MAAGARLPEHAAALGLRLLADDDAGLRAADEAGVVRVRVVSWFFVFGARDLTLVIVPK